MRQRLEARVTGRVQGVMFRDYTTRVARSLKLSGRVWNEPDKSVRVIAEGEDRNIQKLIANLHTCPTLTKIICRVDNVDYEIKEYRGEFNDFKIRY